MEGIINTSSYVLITAARNEEDYIEKTIQSVIRQTVLPKRWIIVSDGSTDRTDEIVKQYAEKYEWIELLRMPERDERNYAAKAHCVNAGYHILEDMDFDLVGNLDADISFENDFFEFLSEKFGEIPHLGVAGTRYVENGFLPIYSFRDVAGQCQLFSRQCFDQIGGYCPSEYGGIDNIAVITARMNGWRTQTFDERNFTHHRLMSTAERNKWGARTKHGREDYLLGNHPLWQVCRILYQMTKKPYIIDGLLLFYGYSTALLTRLERPVSQDFINFYRKEQLQRLKSIIYNLFRLRLTLKET